ncbi:hypothetical protein [uncultured Thermanaerothrix sp.]|uniref:hypothetical protein n=1 Tax=uncultured Thermanaerothrix sp. TaxID=1195149 RepID=UPI00260CF0D7|nr:hypothetical protein [uncultured Thermanaerothrix sp.]
MPVQEPDPQGPAALLVAALMAVLAHLARLLSRGWPGILRLAAGGLGAGVAGFTFGAFIIGISPQEVRSELIWAAGGGLGLCGAGFLPRMGPPSPPGGAGGLGAGGGGGAGDPAGGWVQAPAQAVGGGVEDGRVEVWRISVA